jgi:hypothetical protein
MVAWLICTVAQATTAGQSIADTRYFFAGEAYREYADATRRPTLAQRVAEVNGHWRFLLQCYRTVDNNTTLRASFRRNLLTVQSLGDAYTGHRDLLRAFAARGVSADAIAQQTTAVYTLQLVAYRQGINLRRFTVGLSAAETAYDPMTRIYRQVPKDFHFGYGDESAAYKDDPVYLLTQGQITRVRYGIYENTADAARDAAVWRRRFHVTPYITRVPFRCSLTRNVIWGDVPGIYQQRQFTQRVQ